MGADGTSFLAKKISTDGIEEEIELHSDSFFFDTLLEGELKIAVDLIDFYFVREHAIAFNTMARLINLPLNKGASKIAGFSIYGDVILIPKQFIREA